jgi:hypothetical protein
MCVVFVGIMFQAHSPCYRLNEDRLPADANETTVTILDCLTHCSTAFKASIDQHWRQVSETISYGLDEIRKVSR